MQGLLKLLKKEPTLPEVPDYDPIIRQLEDPDQVIIPLEYPGKVRFLPLVEEGDTVRKGQAVGRSRNGNSVIASISGTVKKMTSVWTPRSVHSPAIVIEKGEGEPLSAEEVFEVPLESGSFESAMERMRAAGVAPPRVMSGREWDDEEGEMRELPPVSTVIVTGIRQETTILTSQLLLEQESDKIGKGLDQIRAFLPNAHICLTAPESLKGMAEQKFSGKADLFYLPDNYTSRIERNIVADILGKRIPNRESFRYHGIVVIDVEYLLAIVDALQGTSALTQKHVTISGAGLEKAITVRFPLGSSIEYVLSSVGLSASDYTRTVVGGPMMGFAQYSDKAPLTYTNGIHLIVDEVAPFDALAPCINCGRCSRVCPENIQVHLINRMIEFGHLDSAENLHPEACHECGLCAHVCPAQRPIVQLLHFCNHEMKHGERTNWAVGGDS